LHVSAITIVYELMASPNLHKITFTGSTEVGKHLIRQSADTVKKVSMELGGNAPFIVFEDANIEKAAEAVIASKFRNAGQTCVCTNRIYVHESIVEEFSQALAINVNKLVVGDGLDADVTIGPLIDNGAVSKEESHISDATKKSAKVLVGGSRLVEGSYKNGHFFQPTVL